MRLHRLMTAFFTAVLVLLGMLATTPVAFAAVLKPNPPVITMVDSSAPAGPTHGQLFRLSPQPGETGYGYKILSYNDQHTTNPSAANDNLQTSLDYAYGDDAGAAAGTGLGQVIDGDGSIPQYVRAQMNVTLSDGTSYTTGWTTWVLVQAPTRGPPPVVTSTCGSLQFVGVRGSGETKASAGGYGDTIAAVKNDVEHNVPGTISTPINYAAIPVDFVTPIYSLRYANSVKDGKQKLQTYLTALFARCSMTSIVLAGYSQGAHVVGDVYEALSDVERKHIAAVVLIGDPRFNPKQSVVDVGTYSKNLVGSYFLVKAPRVIPSRWIANVHSYCVKGDPVCNFSINNGTSCQKQLPQNACIHQLYARDGWATQSAQWAVGHWRSMARF